VEVAADPISEPIWPAAWFSKERVVSSGEERTEYHLSESSKYFPGSWKPEKGAWGKQLLPF
jgi:hypothetical protein